MDKNTAITSRLYYLERDQLFKSEKPYAFKFPLKKAPLPSKDIHHIPVDDVKITDIRDNEQAFTFGGQGFTVMRLECGLEYNDYHNDEKVQPYFRAMEAKVKERLGASKVEVFRYQASPGHTVSRIPLMLTASLAAQTRPKFSCPGGKVI